MAQLTYNGIELDLIRTAKWERDAIYTEDGCDYLYTRHRIEVTAIYNPWATGYETGANGLPQQAFTNSIPIHGGVQAVSPSPATTDRAIRHFLMQPRQQLSFVNPPMEFILGIQPNESDFDELVISPDQDTDAITDAHFGPRPLYCHVREIVGTRTFHVVYGIEVCLIECPSDADNPPAVLSQRWTETHEIDDQYFTTRIISGKVKFRTDALSSINPPSDFAGGAVAWNSRADDYRSQLMHPVPPRFKREAVRIVVTTDGAELWYELVDREQYLSIGIDDPAVRYEAFQTLTTGKNSGGAVLYASAQVRAYGSPKSSKRNLWTRCVQIIDAKLNLNKNTFVTQASVTEDLFRPFVETNISVLLAAPQQNVQGKVALPPANVEFMARGIGQLYDITVKANPGPSGDGISRGAWLGVAAAAAYGSACAGNEIPDAVESLASLNSAQSEELDDAENTDTTTEPGPPTSLGGPEISVSVATEPLDETDNSYSDETQSGIWTEYRIDTAYRRHEGVYVAPVASADGGALTEFVTLHAPTTLKTVAWTAQRIGDWPAYPNPYSPSEVLLRQHISPGAVELLQDGQSMLHTVSGVYYYGCQVPVGAGDDLNCGSLPTIDGPPCELPGDMMDDDILAPCRGTASLSTGGPFPGGGGLSPGQPGGTFGPFGQPLQGMATGSFGDSGPGGSSPGATGGSGGGFDTVPGGHGNI